MILLQVHTDTVKVLDGGTGFLKVGYAAQVRPQTALPYNQCSTTNTMERMVELP